MKKSIRVIEPEQVDAVFSDGRIAELARIARLPADADHQRLASGIRAAARAYARDVRAPNFNEQRAEIDRLYRAANGRQYARVADLITSMSPQVRSLLNKRGARRSPVSKVPTDAAIRDASVRETACGTLASLCGVGGTYGEGRKRKTGKRSRSWQPQLYAPLRYVPKPHAEQTHADTHQPDAEQTYERAPKRDAERTFTMNLQLTWLEVTGRKPSPTAHADSLGPFARLVRECLALVGAAGTNASVVEYIKELNLRRREVKQDKTAPTEEQKRQRRLKRRHSQPQL